MDLAAFSDRWEHLVLKASGWIYNTTLPVTTTVGAPLTPIFAPFYDGLERIAAIFGTNSGGIMYLVFLVLAYPLAIVHRWTPPGTFRHIYSAFFGILFSFLAFNWQAMHSLFVPFVVYVSFYILPRHFVQKFTFAFAFTYLIACHIYRMATDYAGWTVDFSTLQMLITLKTIGVAFNYADGDRPKPKSEDVDVQKAYEVHKRNSISKIPSLLELYSFLFFYPSVLSGPIFEYNDYIAWAETKDLPYSISIVLKKIALAALNIVIFMTITPLFPRANLVEPRLSTFTFTEKIFYAWGATTFCRNKYYIAWYLGEGACITAGFGFNKKYNNWDNVNQSNFYNVEFGTTVRELIANWNIRVSVWLRNYVYTRVPKSLGLTLTFTVSALWHGLYPGYYMMWICFSIVSSIHRSLHKKLRPLIFRSSKNIDDISQEPFVLQFLYNLVAFFVTHLTFSYFAASFQILDLKESIQWYNSVHWIGHIALLAFYIFANYILPTPPNPKTKQN